MSLGTIETREAHRRLDEAPAKVQSAVNRAYRAAVEVLKEEGACRPAGDDRAEELAAAIFYYIKRCRE
jgi:hypothetical protein